jgi:hypothetical protein
MIWKKAKNVLCIIISISIPIPCASVWILLAGFYDLAPEAAKCLKLRTSENPES